MNHLVFLDPNTSDLEKILSGVKKMVLKKINPLLTEAYKLDQGDCLFFLRGVNDSTLRVKADVIKCVGFYDSFGKEIPHFLEEMQPRLQLTENQFNYWSIKKQVLLVEFENAEKIDVIHIAPLKIRDQSDWVAFENFNLIIDKKN